MSTTRTLQPTTFSPERPAELWYLTDARYRRMWEVAARRQLDMALVVENVHDAHNVSAVLRSCDAVGVGGIHMIYTDEAFPRLNQTIASSASMWLPLRRHRSISACYEALRAGGLRIYATTLDPQARSLFTCDLTQPCAVVVGNEQRGVAVAAIVAADETLYIPMQGMVQSFNISVAAAIVLAEAMRQRLAAGRYRLPETLSGPHARLLEQWIKREASRRKNMQKGSGDARTD